MQYLGGKSKIRKQVAKFLESVRKPNQVYFEPFVGGGWVLQEMTGERIASDGNAALIAMYQALQNGWVPPENLDEGTYKFYQQFKPMNDPLTAFCGFGCSFAGKWFGGYARSKGKDCYASTSKRSLMKQLPKIKDVKFIQGDYRSHSPKDMLIYCDPPYAGTTVYGAFDGFDNDEFWQVMRKWSLCNTVVISEYQAPDDFMCMVEFDSRMGLTTSGCRPIRSEKLFMIVPEWLR